MTGWKRRSSAGSPRIHLSYSPPVVAPMIRMSPRTRAGFSMLAASIAAPSESFDDRRLPHPGFPDQGGIVLALTQQDVHHPRDLGVATAHRLQVTAPRLGREIHPHALQHLSRVEQPFERIAHSGQAAPR